MSHINTIIMGPYPLPTHTVTQAMVIDYGDGDTVSLSEGERVAFHDGSLFLKRGERVLRVERFPWDGAVAAGCVA